MEMLRSSVDPLAEIEYCYNQMKHRKQNRSPNSNLWAGKGSTVTKKLRAAVRHYLMAAANLMAAVRRHYCLAAVAHYLRAHYLMAAVNLMAAVRH